MGTTVDDFKMGVDLNRLFLRGPPGERIGGARLEAKRLRNIKRATKKRKSLTFRPTLGYPSFSLTHRFTMGKGLQSTEG